jgi:hypothetical protein
MELQIRGMGPSGSKIRASIRASAPLDFAARWQLM